VPLGVVAVVFNLPNSDDPPRGGILIEKGDIHCHIYVGTVRSQPPAQGSQHPLRTGRIALPTPSPLSGILPLSGP